MTVWHHGSRDKIPQFTWAQCCEPCLSNLPSPRHTIIQTFRYYCVLFSDKVSLSQTSHHRCRLHIHPFFYASFIFLRQRVWGPLSPPLRVHVKSPFMVKMRPKRMQFSLNDTGSHPSKHCLSTASGKLGGKIATDQENILKMKTYVNPCDDESDNAKENRRERKRMVRTLRLKDECRHAERKREGAVIGSCPGGWRPIKWCDLNTWRGTSL